MRHLARILGVAVSIAVAAVPTALADPAVRSFIDHHPLIAGYYPLVSGLVYALYRAWRNRGRTPVVSSSGSPTMGANS